MTYINKCSKIALLTAVIAYFYTFNAFPRVNKEPRTQSARSSMNNNINAIVKESFDSYLPHSYEVKCTELIIESLMENLRTLEQNEHNRHVMENIIDCMLGQCAKDYVYNYLTTSGYSSRVAESVAYSVNSEIVAARSRNILNIGSFINKDRLEKIAQMKQNDELNTQSAHHETPRSATTNSLQRASSVNTAINSQTSNTRSATSSAAAA